MEMHRLFHYVTFIAFGFIAVWSVNGKTKPVKPVKGGTEMVVTSSSFTGGAMIPSKYTCDGADISPPLSWSGTPDAAKSIALICDDPDAPGGVWVHWVAYNIPPTVTRLHENIPAADTLSDSTRQGVNDFRKTGYGGPCPTGGTHRYFFKVYALDVLLPVDRQMTKAKLLKMMEGHVLAEGQLMGKYKRGR
jgi:Raf kinase inhibitor-like YbhB/YbcL family protein